MTRVPRFEEIDDNWTPQIAPNKESTSMTTSTTSTLSRAVKVNAIKLRDPNFDPTGRSDDYLNGRYEASVEARPVVGVPTGEPATKLDDAEHHEVTKAQIACDAAHDRARAAISSVPPKTKRLDGSDTEGLSDVTKAMIAAHTRDELQRRGGSRGGPGDAA
jgi:hypothetical protein